MISIDNQNINISSVDLTTHVSVDNIMFRRKGLKTATKERIKVKTTIGNRKTIFSENH